MKRRIKAVRLVPLQQGEPEHPDQIDWRVKGEFHQAGFHPENEVPVENVRKFYLKGYKVVDNEKQVEDWEQPTIPRRVIVTPTLIIPAVQKKKKRVDWKHVLGIIWFMFLAIVLILIMGFIVVAILVTGKVM